MSMEKLREDIVCTPRRVQKCLFGSGQSSRNKKIHRVETDSKIAGILSGEESDLGPMSPLELSDQSPSSCNGSPRIPLLSPNITPKRLSLSFDMNASWDHIYASACKKERHNHTRMSLKKAIQAVKHTARNDILPDSPRSLSNSPLKASIKQTPNQTEVDMEEFVPETPERKFGKQLQNTVTDTPYKCESPEYKLITPLTTQNKIVLVPRAHRRKSMNTLDIIENFSPQSRRESTLKRHAPDDLTNTVTKFLKFDENQLVPKARAVLFQGKDYESKLKNLSLSPDNFYGNTETKKECKFSSKFPQIKEQRKGFTGHAHSSRKSFKRHAIGRINAGVSHGIRKIKRKTNSQVLRNGNSMQKLKNMQNNMTVQAEVQGTIKVLDTKISSSQPDHCPSAEIDSNKRFFKIKRSLKKNSSAIVKIDNIKLNIASDGTMQLNKKTMQSVSQSHKRAKLVDISFDAPDLTVNEPEEQSTIDENAVANILKVLEDDWAEDDYDSMDILSNTRLAYISPLKPVAILKDVTMSPASELSNMTSSMNIKDISTPPVFYSSSLDIIKENDENTSEPKYYPLFSKGYSSNKTLNESNKKSMKDALNWQLSVKINGDDNQYQLDAGQKSFGAKQCADCGIIYHLGDPEDENAHLNYHNNRKSLKFPGWKTERVVTEDPFTSSRVILIEPSDSKLCWKKVVDVLAYVDRDLGLVDTKLSNYEQKKVYLYIRDKAVIGVLVAEHITAAHRMIPELLELDCCTAESSPAKCGINVVWTDLNHRRQGIATKLIDILRAQFYFGYVMSVDDIAFSIPTPSGKIFAEKYTQTRHFKVYG